MRQPRRRSSRHRSQKQIDSWQKTAARYRSEPDVREGTLELAEQAKEMEKEARHSDGQRTVAAFAHSSIGGLIITPNPFAFAHRDLIFTLAARHKLPAIYYDRTFVAAGGLISYGLISSTSTGAPPATSIAFSRARSLLTCRCRRRPSTNW